MADEDLATRAPENDALESSPVKGDSVAQEGPSMGEHCVTDRPTRMVIPLMKQESELSANDKMAATEQRPTGEITKLGDIDVYITKPADYPHSPSKLLLLLTGGTGFKSTNNQLQADRYASEGFLVVMPDQFGGDPAPNAVSEPATKHLSLIERIKLGISDTAKSFVIDMWLARQTPERVLPRLMAVISAAKEEFADALASGGGLYAVGYCIGAKYVLILGGEHPDSVLWGQDKAGDAEAGAVVKGPLIKAAAIAHGVQVTADEMAALKVPTLLICVENDPLFPDEVRKAGLERLEKSGTTHELKVYPEVPHGFAVLGDYDDTKIREAQQDAFAQMLAWVQEH